MDALSRQETGIPELDDITGGGIPQGHVVLLAGDSGTGKTLLGFHFIMEGLRNGETCLYISFEESQQQLLRNAGVFGWDLEPYCEDGSLHVLASYPEQVAPEKRLDEIADILETTDIDRVVVDPITAIGEVFPEELYTSFARRIVALLKHYQITGMVTSSTPGLMEVANLSQSKLSTLSDNIFLLKYVEMRGSLNRVLTVLKTRGSYHDERLWEYTITEEGIQLEEALQAYEGVLSGSATKVAPTVEQQLQDLFRDVLGPIGSKEFKQLKAEGLTEQHLHDYFQRLEEGDILSEEKLSDLRRRALDIYTATEPEEKGSRDD